MFDFKDSRVQFPVSAASSVGILELRADPKLLLSDTCLNSLLVTQDKSVISNNFTIICTNLCICNS